MARQPDEPSNELSVSPGARLVYWASGYDTGLLAKAPRSEHKIAFGTGTAVLITASMACISMAFALSIALPQSAVLLRVAFSLFYALAILLIDRFFVSLQLRPFRLEEGVRQPGAGRVFLAGAPRLVFSIVIGFIIAEPLLLAVFHPEITRRVEILQDQLADEATASMKKSQDSVRDRLPAPSAESKRLADIKEQLLPNAERDLAAKELQATQSKKSADLEEVGARGNVGAGALTGKNGCLAACEAHKAQAEIYEKEAIPLRAKRDDLLRERDDLQSRVGPIDASRNANNEERIRNDEAAVKEAESKARRTEGLLIRIEALEQLSRDKTPFSLNDASGATNVNTFAGLTAIGIVSWLLRLWLVLLDTLPMLFKMMQSMRTQRPYDALVAEEEQRVIGESLTRADTRRTARIALQTSLRETEMAADSGGGTWVDTGDGRVLVGPNGSVFIPASMLKEEPAPVDGVRIVSRDDGSAEAEAAAGPDWPLESTDGVIDLRGRKPRPDQPGRKMVEGEAE